MVHSTRPLSAASSQCEPVQLSIRPLPGSLAWDIAWSSKLFFLPVLDRRLTRDRAKHCVVTMLSPPSWDSECEAPAK